MKKFTRIILMFLVFAMTMGLLCACESTQDKIDALAGTWSMVVADTEEQAVSLLENADMYPEEIAFADLTSLQYVQTVEFTSEKTYRFAYDSQATKACIRAFFAGFFDALYENRTALNDVYTQDFGAMSQEEFRQFYADMYSMADYEALLDQLVEIAYNYDILGEAWETGTYTIRGEEIFCTITGQTVAEALGYTISGNTLTLTYLDGVETYTKAS